MQPLVIFAMGILPMFLVALISENRKFIEAVNQLREANGTMNGFLPFAVPFQVSIQVKLGRRYQHLCGGSIIHEQVVLTAAHCFYQKHPTKHLRVIAGVQNLSEDTAQRYDVAQVIRHKAFAPLQGYDIALVSLTFPLPIDGVHFDTVDYRSGGNVEDSLETYLIGWGRTKGMLEIVAFTTVQSNDCRLLGFTYVTSTDLCAYSATGRGACDGDSGGALLTANLTKQIGLLSYGKSFCKRNHIYVYTSVFRLIDWIDEQIESLVGTQNFRA
ncbi:plasma kallikrein-like [Bactrocera neohumeralis]|uniref:plasma kallikrein-like n=1 Tax=Bactrocera neohumeralis TaxID=98809 RepID=UPI002165C01A|nr:plasma kallikrein-like [Bactrocera neohumeralis]